MDEMTEYRRAFLDMMTDRFYDRTHFGPSRSAEVAGVAVDGALEFLRTLATEGHDLPSIFEAMGEPLVEETDETPVVRGRHNRTAKAAK